MLTFGFEQDGEQGGDKDDVKRKKQPNGKVTWLLTYGAAGPSITPLLLEKHKALMVDECYTATDRANKYTLLHLRKRVRHTAMEKVMKVLSKELGIALAEVYGYDRVVSDSAAEPDAVKSNALYLWLVANLKKHDPAFEYWISPDKKTKGLLSEHMEAAVGSDNFMKWSKRKLARTLFAERETGVRRKNENAVLRLQVDFLRQQNQELQTRAAELEKALPNGI